MHREFRDAVVAHEGWSYVADRPAAAAFPQQKWCVRAAVLLVAVPATTA